MMSLSGLRPEGYRVQKGGPKEDRKVPFLARSSGPENRPKKAFFWTLRRKVQGEWGGSAHSPDPTAQSAQAAESARPATVAAVRRGSRGLWGGAWGPAVLCVVLCFCCVVELRSVWRKASQGRGYSGRSLRFSSGPV